jgi:hypothetical protein
MDLEVTILSSAHQYYENFPASFDRARAERRLKVKPCTMFI